MQNSRRCDVCNIDNHRASYGKHLRSKKFEETLQKNPSIFSNETNKVKPKNNFVPKPLKVRAREKLKKMIKN